MVFVNSMSDLFHKDIPINFLKQVFYTMKLAPRHTFQVLTKRADRLHELKDDIDWPDNVWMGVSAENQKYWDERVPLLMEVPAKVRFVSAEPLLGPITMGEHRPDWLIVGGESGPGARKMEREWARALLRETSVAIPGEQIVPFFFKQWGAFNQQGQRVGKKKAGRLLDGRTWDEMPEVSYG